MFWYDNENIYLYEALYRLREKWRIELDRYKFCGPDNQPLGKKNTRNFKFCSPTLDDQRLSKSLQFVVIACHIFIAYNAA